MKFPTNTNSNSKKDNKVEEQINNIKSCDSEILKIKAVVEEIRKEAVEEALYMRDKILEKRERQKQKAQATAEETEKKEDNAKSFFTINLLSKDEFDKQIEWMTKREEEYYLKLANSLDEAQKNNE
ncbi:hypothetical protein P9074_11300 [Gallibacterium anatis]|uniref:hypothetical protein n=2 Tax=Gallibacterium anatis TaxID=750 RepID=UPI000530F7A2|nr:hypothetical protein [Gallibacterium anatis]KGQ68516.1 hypothetical protein IO47_04450 [Gallibacterium anatis]